MWRAAMNCAATTIVSGAVWLGVVYFFLFSFSHCYALCVCNWESYVFAS
uniref:Uncharacterized protein n=1 Tax=Aegilops tauschii subsp. strangulata TaxID=200361 RepID=A0A452Z3X3_AEGTS